VIGESYRAAERWLRLQDRVAANGPMVEAVDTTRAMAAREALASLEEPEREVLLLSAWGLREQPEYRHRPGRRGDHSRRTGGGRWAVVDFWAGPEESETPRFTWFIQGEPIGFAQVDHQALAQ
jgi:hypothetical protein